MQLFIRKYLDPARVSETIRNYANKKQKGRFLIMVLGTLGANLFENLLGKGTVRERECTIRAGKGTIRATQDFSAASSFNKF